MRLSRMTPSAPAMSSDAMGQPATRGPRPASRGQVLVVDDHAQARESLAFALRAAGHRVDACSSAAEAIQLAARQPIDCIVTDLQMPGMNGVELIAHLRRQRCRARIVMVTAHASVASAVEAMREGAFDYLEKPFDLERIEALVSQAVDHRRLEDRVEGGEASPSARGAPPALIGSSVAIRQLREMIEQFAPTAENVLITGENGTGKEVVARMIHAASDRAAGPWVSLNCPALAPHLMESELFGHEKGAFTGADSLRVGRFEQAHRGTLLLDEVTEIDLPLQAKLLRVLQERCFERVGASTTLYVDVRILATTNRDLEQAVAEFRFRQDLYYRLAVLPIWVPPLRARKEDIPELVQFFLERSARQLHREPCALDDGALQRLMEHNWPGNVRELENVVKRAGVLGAGVRVTADQIERWLIGRWNAVPSPEAVRASGDATPIRAGIRLDEAERRLIEATLELHKGHRQRTAETLGIGVRTLCGKLRQYGYAPREKSFTDG